MFLNPQGKSRGGAECPAVSSSSEVSASIPERKSKSVSVCETLPKSRPNNDNSVESLPSQADGASVGGGGSLPLPQRSQSTGKYYLGSPLQAEG